MQRPDLNTLTCVNPACQLFRHAGAKNLVIRKVSGTLPYASALLPCAANAHYWEHST